VRLFRLLASTLLFFCSSGFKPRVAGFEVVDPAVDTVRKTFFTLFSRPFLLVLRTFFLERFFGPRQFAPEDFAGAVKISSSFLLSQLSGSRSFSTFFPLAGYFSQCLSLQTFYCRFLSLRPI